MLDVIIKFAVVAAGGSFSLHTHTLTHTRQFVTARHMRVRLYSHSKLYCGNATIYRYVFFFARNGNAICAARVAQLFVTFLWGGWGRRSVRLTLISLLFELVVGGDCSASLPCVYFTQDPLARLAMQCNLNTVQCTMFIDVQNIRMRRKRTHRK